MNDPNKRIDVNISSLLSLKAELLRKREEVSKTKQQTTESFVPKKFSSKSSSSSSLLNDRNDKIENKNLSDDADNRNKNFIEEYEDSSILDKSRKVLEAKSRFYEKMTESGGSLNSDDNCLVLFNQKKQEDKSDNRRNSMEKHHSSDSNDSRSSNGDYDNDCDNDDINKNPDEEWIEYTDCLGRTRKCLKKDLEFFKKKDMQLAENIQPRIELNQNAPMWMIDTKGSNITNPSEIDDDDVSEMTSVMSKHDQMKMNWEKKEEENVYKENVHYQDVLFDEARQHGVGYYAFSTDEEQRAKQRKALDELREKTLTEQKQKEAQREQREKIITERVRAAKNRQRARLGLPPLEDESESEKKSEPLYDTKEEEKRKRKEEKERRKKEKEEKLREEERKKHIRPWDKNKDSVSTTRRNHSTKLSDDSDVDDNKKGKEEKEEEWKYRREREPMSQEQWNEMKRNERKQEFAPPPAPQSEKQQPKPLRSFRSQPDYEDNSNWTAHQFTTPETLYFTTMKQKTDSDSNREQPSSLYNRKEFRKRNYISSDISDSSNRNDLEKCQENEEEQYCDKDGGGVEIPPPATFEYYGPSSSRSKRSKPTQKTDLEQSIEAGLKFIRNRSDKGILPVKSSWTANASNVDY